MISKIKNSTRIDWIITLVPLVLIITLCGIFFVAPDISNTVLSEIRFFFGDTLGSYYLIIGLGIFLFSIFIACSNMVILYLEIKMRNPNIHFLIGGV